MRGLAGAPPCAGSRHAGVAGAGDHAPLGAPDGGTSRASVGACAGGGGPRTAEVPNEPVARRRARRFEADARVRVEVPARRQDRLLRLRRAVVGVERKIVRRQRVALPPPASTAARAGPRHAGLRLVPARRLGAAERRLVAPGRGEELRALEERPGVAAAQGAPGSSAATGTVAGGPPAKRASRAASERAGRAGTRPGRVRRPEETGLLTVGTRDTARRTRRSAAPSTRTTRRCGSCPRRPRARSGSGKVGRRRSRAGGRAPAGRGRSPRAARRRWRRSGGCRTPARRGRRRRRPRRSGPGAAPPPPSSRAP